MDRREERAAGSQRPADPAHHAEPASAATTEDDALDIRQVEAEQEFRDEQARRAADALERRQGDIALRDELAAAGFDGRLWRRFTHELACYGHAVVVAWLRTNEMFAQCKKKGCYPGPPPLTWQTDDVQSLANDTVTQGILDFRERALLGGGWKPNGGASLKTYFVGRCVFAFPNFYRKWCTEQDHRRRLSVLCVHTDDVIGVSSSDLDPADVALQRTHVWQGFYGIDDLRTKKAIILQEAGYQLEEIAELLDEPSRDVIRGALQRQRQRGQRSRREGGLDV